MDSSNLINTRLGKYIIQAEIGRGGMGAVYRAYDPDLERYVAIKVLAPHLVWQKEFVERFMREARAAARLKHPNIVTIYDVGQQGDWYYFVMEYLEGQSLTQLIRRRGPLPAHELAGLLRPLAEALDFAHRQGLIHRDIKPDNIILETNGQPKLTDFGIARATQESRLTSTGAIVGTPAYMSPEQAKGLAVDARSDQYSLGVVAYELLSGRVPFEADSTLALLNKVAYEPLPSLRQMRPDLPPQVEAVMERGLAKEPNARYPTVRIFWEALEGALAGRPVRAAAPYPHATPARGGQRGLWIGLGIIGVVLVGVVILLVMGLSGGGRDSPLLPTKTPTTGMAIAMATSTPQTVRTPTQAGPATVVVVVTATPEPGRSATAEPATVIVIVTATPEPTRTPTRVPARTFTPTPKEVSFYWSRLGYSVQSREIPVAIIGNEMKKAIVIVGALDGSQTNTQDLVDRLISHFARELEQIPDDVTFYLVPSINPDGVAINDRYNANGVDINRNWDTRDWTPNPGEPGYPEGKTGAGGSSPFSEPETRALCDLLQNLDRQASDLQVIVLHSSVTLSQGDGKVFPGSTSKGLHQDSLEASRRFAGEMGYSLEVEWSDYTTAGEVITWCAEQDITSIDVVFSKKDTASSLEVDFVQALLEAIQ